MEDEDLFKKTPMLLLSIDGSHQEVFLSLSLNQDDLIVESIEGDHGSSIRIPLAAVKMVRQGLSIAMETHVKRSSIEEYLCFFLIISQGIDSDKISNQIISLQAKTDKDLVNWFAAIRQMSSAKRLRLELPSRGSVLWSRTKLRVQTKARMRGRSIGNIVSEAVALSAKSRQSPAPRHFVNDENDDDAEEEDVIMESRKKLLKHKSAIPSTINLLERSRTHDAVDRNSAMLLIHSLPSADKSGRRILKVGTLMKKGRGTRTLFGLKRRNWKKRTFRLLLTLPIDRPESRGPAPNHGLLEYYSGERLGGSIIIGMWILCSER